MSHNGWADTRSPGFSDPGADDNHPPSKPIITDFFRDWSSEALGNLKLWIEEEVVKTTPPFGPGVIITTVTPQAVASVANKYSGGTTIAFTTVAYESADSRGMLDLPGAPTTVTIIKDGIYLITAGGDWAPSVDTAYRRIYADGGSDIFEGNNPGSAVNTYSQTSHGYAGLPAGHTMTLLATQSSGVSQNILQANLQVQWVGPFDGIFGPRF